MRYVVRVKDSEEASNEKTIFFSKEDVEEMKQVKEDFWDRDEYLEDLEHMPTGHITKEMWDEFLKNAKWPYWNSFEDAYEEYQYQLEEQAEASKLKETDDYTPHELSKMNFEEEKAMYDSIVEDAKAGEETTEEEIFWDCISDEAKQNLDIKLIKAETKKAGSAFAISHRYEITINNEPFSAVVKYHPEGEGYPRITIGRLDNSGKYVSHQMTSEDDKLGSDKIKNILSHEDEVNGIKKGDIVMFTKGSREGKRAKVYEVVAKSPTKPFFVRYLTPKGDVASMGLIRVGADEVVKATDSIARDEAWRKNVVVRYDEEKTPKTMKLISMRHPEVKIVKKWAHIENGDLLVSYEVSADKFSDIMKTVRDVKETLGEVEDVAVGDKKEESYVIESAKPGKYYSENRFGRKEDARRFKSRAKAEKTARSHGWSTSRVRKIADEPLLEEADRASINIRVSYKNDAESAERVAALVEKFGGEISPEDFKKIRNAADVMLDDLEADTKIIYAEDVRDHLLDQYRRGADAFEKALERASASSKDKAALAKMRKLLAKLESNETKPSTIKSDVMKQLERYSRWDH